MAEKPYEMSTESQEVEIMGNKHKGFNKRTIRLNALASSMVKSDNFDVEQAEQESQEGLAALAAKGGLQEMLAAQMLSIHNLQQQAMTLAIRTTHLKNIQYFTNAAVKLANCFTQQANTLSRLQGHISHKITVEHVDVHHGGQAIVGNVGVPTSIDMEKK